MEFRGWRAQRKTCHLLLSQQTVIQNWLRQDNRCLSLWNKWERSKIIKKSSVGLAKYRNFDLKITLVWPKWITNMDISRKSLQKWLISGGECLEVQYLTKKMCRCDVAILKKSEFCHLYFLMSFQNCTTFFVCGNKKKIFWRLFLSIEWKSMRSKTAFDHIDFHCMNKKPWDIFFVFYWWKKVKLSL